MEGLSETSEKVTGCCFGSFFSGFGASGFDNISKKEN
jgi:hypothetical protein